MGRFHSFAEDHNPTLSVGLSRDYCKLAVIGELPFLFRSRLTAHFLCDLCGHRNLT
jgi:hypothetical protein